MYYHALYVYPDGELNWQFHANDVMYEDIPHLIKVGTGSSVPCGCEGDCEIDEDIHEVEKDAYLNLAKIRVGYFDDEEDVVDEDDFDDA
jgi:hypothetical protein